MNRRVLVIDDDRDHAESIVDILTMRGHQVEAAFSGEAGVKLFREEDFDIVFMDVKLPGMNGVETFFEFKKIRPDARVMMMTGYSVEELISQAIANGALGVLRKPFAIGDLLRVLDEVKPRGLILVADDDPDFAESLQPILAEHGYSVEVASTGQEALEKATQAGVNCLILDLSMPLLTGVEVYLKLKELGKSIPTIFVTGFPGEKTAALTGPRPVDRGILMKPFDPQDLIHAIAAATAGSPPAAHG
ncbi:MAG TPA: response regulator [Stellaceae bacterium]|jgi:two-component system response regulator HydG|nr:response regulator [Stellaceae bacterium]